MSALCVLARALGVREGGGCRCAVCGPSHFDGAGSTRRALGTNFTDYDQLADAGAAEVCAGCVRLMAGRPGDDPPPLRTVSVRVGPDARLRVLDREAWWAMLVGDDEVAASGEVLSWATSRKRHHWLRAGISTPRRWAVGSDDGTIVWVPDPSVPAAVLALREIGATKGAILSGHYPVRLTSEHLPTIERAEAEIEPLRGHPIVDLIVWAAPTIDRSDQRPAEESEMIDPLDARAAELIATLVWGSEMRANDGKVFWSGYLLRRLRRFRRLPLATCVSRLIADCRVSAGAASSAVSLLGEMDADQVTETERALRDRTDLIHALAFARMAEYRAARRPQEPTS